MSGNSSKRNNGYVARGQSSVKNRNSVSKGKRTKKTLGFDLSDTESRIAFWAFIVISVLMLALLVAGFGLGISRCISGDEDIEEDTVQPAEAIVSYADGYVSGGDIVSFADIVSPSGAE